MNHYCFDFYGAYVGHIDQDGLMYDPDGKPCARVAEDGSVHDLARRHLGHLDCQGSFLADDGTCPWYARDWKPLAPYRQESTS
ncbi:MAG: 4-fold beta flower protein [Candidatus Binatia bacterium]